MKRIVYILSLVLLAGFSSCNVKDPFDGNCYRPYMLIVRMDVRANDDFFPENFAPGDMSLMDVPREVLVYVFSEQGVLLGIHRSTIGKIIELPYPDQPSIRTVAVATAEGVDIESMFPALHVGQTYTDHQLLYTLTPYDGFPQYARSPVDFMYAADRFLINTHTDYNTLNYLWVMPRIGALKIRTLGLSNWANTNYGPSGLAQDDFRFVVGATRDTYLFNGNLYGPPTYGATRSYLPQTTYVDAEHLETPTFCMMPTVKPETFTISIYRNNMKIYPRTTSQQSITYALGARAPYIVDLNFYTEGVSVTPSQFLDVYINVKF